MKADKAFEIAMNSPQCAGPRCNILEDIYTTIGRVAETGALQTSYQVHSNGTVLSQVISCLRREGYVVNPGFSNGSLIISWT